ncbi:MAG: hypothetical protein K8W52_45645 [Deltaproteobacteria bacterium]|nr:hypothetical protein [Deltaproteobacteria bacterium]
MLGIAIALTVLTTACAPLPKPTLVGDPTTVHYAGQLLPSGCEPAYQGRAKIVADLVCGRSGYASSDVKELYGAMDLANPEPFDVALLLIACVESGQCTGLRLNPTRLADLHHYAATLDPRALARTLTALPLDGELRAMFYRRAEACRAAILAQVAAMPPRWASVFLDPLEDARVRIETLAVASADQEASLAKLTARVDAALLAKKPDPALHAEIEALRRDNARACMELGHELSFCMAATTLGRTLTRLQAQLAILAGDPAEAAADRELLVDVAGAGGERGELRRAMAESIERERAREKELAAARERGVQEATIEHTRGGPPLLDRDFDILVGDSAESRGAPDLALDIGSLTELEAQVESVGRRGDLADVTFRKEMQENSEGYGCYETNKVVQISERGEVIYDTQCAGYKTTYTNRGPARVTVPWAEVRRLRHGMIAYVVVDSKTRRGHVIGLRAAPAKPFESRTNGEDLATYLELRGIERVAAAGKQPPIAAVIAAAMTAERRGDWATAAKKLEAAYAAHAHPPLLLGLARALEAQNDLAGAVDAYQRYLALGADLPRVATARAAIDELQARISGRGPAAAPPLPAFKPYGLLNGMSVGGGSTDRNGGIAVLHLWSGVTALDQHVEGDLFAEVTGGDVSGMFGIGARGFALTGLIRPYVLGAVGIGKYSSNTSRPVRSAELGGGVALMHTAGRRFTMGLNAELSHRWTSIGGDPVFTQIMPESDEATLFRIGFVVGFRGTK